MRDAIIIRTATMCMYLHKQLIATQHFGVELINVVSACIPVSIVDACITNQFGPVEESIDCNSFWCCRAPWILLCLCHFKVEKLLKISTNFISGHPM